MPSTSEYIGDELSLFSHAKNWKNYWGNCVRPYLGAHVLEVGAGLGGTTKYLSAAPSVSKWVCLEPDPSLAQQITSMIAEKQLADYCEVHVNTLADLPKQEKFDSILYIDVIEHIEKHAEELQLAASFLKKGGYLIILVPAHQALYSKFDQSIGHYRRYSRAALKAIIPPELKIEQHKYLDAVGLLASVANKLFLKQDYPKLKQILFWDKVMVPISKMLDPVMFFSLGKSILLICQK